MARSVEEEAAGPGTAGLGAIWRWLQTNRDAVNGDAVLARAQACARGRVILLLLEAEAEEEGAGGRLRDSRTARRRIWPMQSTTRRLQLPFIAEENRRSEGPVAAGAMLERKQAWRGTWPGGGRGRARGRAPAARGGAKQRRLEAGRSRARGTELRCKIHDGRRVLCSLREKRRERKRVTGETRESGNGRRRREAGLAD